MKTIDEQIDDIFKREGHEYHVSDQPTGAGGISLRYAKGIGLDNDGDGDVDVDDIKLVTLAQARELYKQDFFYGPRIDALPAQLQPQMFDTAVNSGAPRAIMILQQTLNRRFGYNLSEDGRVGKKSREAADSVCNTFGWRRLNDDMVNARCAFLRAIVERDETQRRFLNGWLRRAESFRATA